MNKKSEYEQEVEDVLIEVMQIHEKIRQEEDKKKKKNKDER